MTSRLKMLLSMTEVWLSSMKKLRWRPPLSRMLLLNSRSQSLPVYKLSSSKEVKRRWSETVSLILLTLLNPTSISSRWLFKTSRWMLLQKVSLLLRLEPQMDQAAALQPSQRLTQDSLFLLRLLLPPTSNSRSSKNKWRSSPKRMPRRRKKTLKL